MPQYELLRTNWGSSDIDSFTSRITFIYDGQSHVEVPRFVYTNRETDIDQSMPDNNMTITYYVFDDENCDHVSFTITYGPNDSYDHGLSPEIIERLSVTEARLSGPGLTDGIRYIGYRISCNGITLQDGSYSVDEGTGEVILGPNDTGPHPFIMGVEPASPIVRITGNKEEFGADGFEHTVIGYRYEVDPIEQTEQAELLSSLLNRGLCAINPPSNNVRVSNYEGGVDKGPGTYTSYLVPSDFGLVGTGSNDYTWMNFRPRWDIQRQVTLVIAGGEIYSGVGTPVSASKYYDGQPLMPEVNIPSNASIHYKLGDGDWQEDPVGITQVGSAYVTVWIQVSGKEDQFAYYYLQVLPLPITLKSGSSTKYYDGLPLYYDVVTAMGIDSDPVAAGGRSFDIALIGGDYVRVTFIGAQTSVGSSQNIFNYNLNTLSRARLSNYDIRTEFGILQVNTNTFKRIVNIIGNSLEVVYDGEEHWVSGYEVESITDEHGDPVADYTERDFEFINTISGETRSLAVPEARGRYINTITDPDDENYWVPVPYVSKLSEFNFRNVNTNFSDKNIEFNVTPNTLTINRREVEVGITAPNKSYKFNMIKDSELIGAIYEPEPHTVSGCTYNISDELYEKSNIIYIKDDQITTPSITASTWNEDSEDGIWYMNLDNDIHNDIDDPESGFINNNKNFEVEFFVEEDGYLEIIPIDVKVNIYGSNKTVEYTGEEQSIEGTSEKPEIWWNSDCSFYNQFSKRESMKVTKDSKKTTIYRAEHNMKYFEWTNDGEVRGTNINNEDISSENYWTPIPYNMELDIEDFSVDTESQFDESLTYLNYIYRNFNVTFELIEDGWLKIEPYSQQINISVEGNTSEVDWEGSEQSISGFVAESDNELYPVDFENYIDFRDGSISDDAEATGTDPGKYYMGLDQEDFQNINHNFSNISFVINDGWISIGEYDSDQNIKYTGIPRFIFTGQDHTWDATSLEGSAGVNLNVSIKNENGQWEGISGTTVEVSKDAKEVWVKIDGVSDKETSTGTIKLIQEPLRLEITTESHTWNYDGEFHTWEHAQINYLNTNVTPEEDAQIQVYIQQVLNDLSQWSFIKEVSQVPNRVFISPNSQILSDVSNGSVVITKKYGYLTVIDPYKHISIKGKQSTIVYDGEKHSLEGYDSWDSNTGDPINIYLKAGFQYTDTIDQWKPAEDERYYMGLTEDSFECPPNITIDSVEDGWLEILKRPASLITASANAWAADLNPDLKAERYIIRGLAPTDKEELDEWSSASEPGTVVSNMPHTIRIINSINNEEVSSDCYTLDTTYGNLRIWDGSTGPYYRILGIRKDKSTPDNESEKIHISNLEKIDGLERLVDEDRFYPIMHKLTPVPENGEVEYNDVICVIPHVRHSQEIEITSWMFENRSTGKKIFSQLRTRPISPDYHQGEYLGEKVKYQEIGGIIDTAILNTRPQLMEPGYYDVVLNYKLGETEYSQRFSSVFVIKKRS